VATPLAVCEGRDVKGLYAASRDGRLPGLTGVCTSAPYEAPACPEVRLTGEGDVREAARQVINVLERDGLIPGEGRRGRGPANNAVPLRMQ
jgi:adenylylsulfate kinase-like enzyme